MRPDPMIPSPINLLLVSVSLKGSRNTGEKILLARYGFLLTSYLNICGGNRHGFNRLNC